MGAKETKPNDSNKKGGGDKTDTVEDASSSSDDEETIAKKAEEVRAKREAQRSLYEIFSKPYQFLGWMILLVWFCSQTNQA